MQSLVGGINVRLYLRQALSRTFVPESKVLSRYRCKHQMHSQAEHRAGRVRKSIPRITDDVTEGSSSHSVLDMYHGQIDPLERMTKALAESYWGTKNNPPGRPRYMPAVPDNSKTQNDDAVESDKAESTDPSLLNDIVVATMMRMHDGSESELALDIKGDIVIRPQSQDSNHKLRIKASTSRIKGKQGVRYALLSSINRLSEDSLEQNSCISKHPLVLRLEQILHKINTISDKTNRDPDMQFINSSSGKSTEYQDILNKAWATYVKIQHEEGANEILKQLNIDIVTLFITEMNFNVTTSNRKAFFSRIERIVDDVSKADISKISLLSFLSYLRAKIKSGKPHQVIEAVSKVLKYPKSTVDRLITSKTMCQVIVAYYKINQPAKAMEVFETIKKAPNLEMTPRAYCAVISGGLRSKTLSDSQIHEFLDELILLLKDTAAHDKMKTGIFNYLLHVCGSSLNKGAFFATFSRFIKDGTVTDLTTFSIILNASYILNPDVDDLYMVYKSMINNRETYELMSHHIFGVFVNKFVRGHDLERAYEVIQDMSDHPTVRPTELNFSHLFDYFKNNSMVDDTLSLYHSLIDVFNVEPRWRIYSDIAETLNSGGSIMAAFRIIKDPKMKNDKRAMFDAHAVVLVKSGGYGDYKSMFECFEKLRSLDPESVLPYVLIFYKANSIARHRARAIQYGLNSVSRLGAGMYNDENYHEFVGEIRKCFEKLVEFSKTHKVIDGIYNIVILVFSILRDMDSAQRVYSYMVDVEGYEPSKYTFNAVINSFVLNFDFSSAKEALANIRNQNIPLYRHTFNALIYGYINAGLIDDALDVYSYMVNRPIPLMESPDFTNFVPLTQPDEYTYAYLINGLINSGLYNEAVVVFEDSFSTIEYVTRRLFESLVSGLENASQFTLADICLKRYRIRVELAQPLEEQMMTDDGNMVAIPDPPADKLPSSYYRYNLNEPSDE